MFLVYYLDWTDSWNPEYINLFVTADEELAKKYVDKFNTKIEKLIEYYRQLNETYGSDDDSDEAYAVYNKFAAWEKVGTCYYKVGTCYYKEIKVRLIMRKKFKPSSKFSDHPDYKAGGKNDFISGYQKHSELCKVCKKPYGEHYGLYCPI